MKNRVIFLREIEKNFLEKSKNIAGKTEKYFLKIRKKIL